MSFIDDILTYKSVSIVGLAKNAGKTETLNYILKKTKDTGKQFAVTSIGIDGESQDQVTQTSKPEIEIYEGMIFITSEKHYKQKRLISEILDVSTKTTSLGRLVTSRALISGKALLSGPSDTASLKEVIKSTEQWNVDTIFVDGAISRLSLGSPTVTDAMVLATGAAVSRNIPELLRKTNYVYELIKIDAVENDLLQKLSDIDNGVWAIDKEGKIHDLEIPSILMLEQYKENVFKYGNTIFVAGIVSDNFLQFLRLQKQIKDITLIVKDFTRIFASMESYYGFIKKGGQIRVLYKSKLLAITINPKSPDGYTLDSEELKFAMEKALQIPVYNIRNER